VSFRGCNRVGIGISYGAARGFPVSSIGHTGFMLTITETAAEAIRAIVEESQLPDEAGLRFALDSVGTDEVRLEVAVAPEPVEGDAEVESAGAHVYLDPQAAVVLDDKVLDAQPTGDGQIAFSFADQASQNGHPH
jgi:iron-sulfur cluster assembly protein